MRRFLKKVLENGREEKRGVVYGWYTGGIRRIYGDIRGYTQYIVSIAYIGFTGIYGWYTGGIRGGIRVLYGW